METVHLKRSHVHKQSAIGSRWVIVAAKTQLSAIAESNISPLAGWRVAPLDLTWASKKSWNFRTMKLPKSNPRSSAPTSCSQYSNTRKTLPGCLGRMLEAFEISGNGQCRSALVFLALAFYLSCLVFNLNLSTFCSVHLPQATSRSSTMFGCLSEQTKWTKCRNQQNHFSKAP